MAFAGMLAVLIALGVAVHSKPPIQFCRFDYDVKTDIPSIVIEEGLVGRFVANNGDTEQTQNLVTQLHAHGIPVFMYMFPFAIGHDDAAGYGLCGTWDLNDPVHGGHPADWFLHDPNGDLLLFNGYPGYILNFANPAVREACIEHALSLVEQGKFDGVFWDDFFPAPFPFFPSGVDCAYVNGKCKYKEKARQPWESDVRTYAHELTAALHAHGKKSFINLGITYYRSRNDWSNGPLAFPNVWQRYNEQVDGAMEESWASMYNNAEPIPFQFWQTQLSHVAWNERHERISLLKHYYDPLADPAGVTFALASALLVSNKYTWFDTSQETWLPVYQTARAVGSPIGNYRVLRGDAYLRRFQNGIVVVNPTDTTLKNIALGGKFRSGKKSVTRVTLIAHSGVILTRA